MHAYVCVCTCVCVHVRVCVCSVFLRLHILEGPVTFITKQVVLWMMFGCKYVNQMLEAMGSQQADERGMHELLGSLQQIESLLPE